MTQKQMAYALNAHALGRTILCKRHGSRIWEKCTDKPESWDFEKNCYCVIPHNFKVGDKVRVKNGKDIFNYAGNWVDAMSASVGRTFDIGVVFTAVNGLPGCRLLKDPGNWIYDFRGLEPVEETDNN